MQIRIFLTLLLVLLTGLIFQFNLMLNGDVSWDLLVTKRLLAGGTYSNSFYDLNPPLIFYLFTPVILITKLFAVGNKIALPIYMMLLGVLSLYISNVLLIKIFNKAQYLQKNILLITLAGIFFILPLNSMGERDQIMFVLSFPYFLLIAARLQKLYIPNLLAIGVGLLASGGFFLKPYFCIAPFLLEIYYLNVERKFFCWCRVEIITLLIAGIAYIAFIRYFHADYFTEILPSSINYYYGNFKSSWMEVLFEPIIMYSVVLLVVFFRAAPKFNPPQFAKILWIGLLSFTLVYFVQQTNWTYHYYPAFAFCLLITMFWFTRLLQKTQSLIKIISVGLLLFLIPVLVIQENYEYAQYNNKDILELKEFLNSHAKGKSVYALTANALMFPIVEYVDVKFPSRFLHLFWMPIYVKWHADHTPLTLQQQQDEAKFTRWITDEIVTLKPNLLFIDSRHYKSYVNNAPFDYLDYYLKDPNFKRAFKSYRYVTTLEKFSGMDNGLSGWNLYWYNKKDDIDLKQINNNSIVLVGNSNPKSAYLVEDHQFLKSKYAILQVPVNLTSAELQLLKAPGKMDVTKHEEFLMLIKKSIDFPMYRLDVYERQ